MELNTISNTGSWGNSANRLNENFSKVNTEVEKLKNATTKNKGYFKTDALLKQTHQTAYYGDIAYVGTSYPYQIWTWNGSSWEDSGATGGDETVNLGNYYTISDIDTQQQQQDDSIASITEKQTAQENKIIEVEKTLENLEVAGVDVASADKLGGITAETKTEAETVEAKIDPETGKLYVPAGGNNPDNEDLEEKTNEEGTKVIQFADKEYNAAGFSGLGRVYLRRNISASKNVLTQDMMSQANTRYIVQYDYDLNGGTIDIPKNCELEFQGGTFKNGIINFNNTFISTKKAIFNSDIQLKGKILNTEFYIRWWNIKNDGTNDFRNAIQNSINALNSGTVIFDSGTYLVKGTNDSIVTSPYPGTSRENDGITPISNISYKGNNTIILCDNSSYYLFNTKFTSDNEESSILENVRFEGITFKCNDTNFIEQSFLFQIESVKNITFDDCNFLGWRGDAICFGFRNDSAYSKVMRTIVENVKIKNCIFDGVSKNNRQAISFYEANNVVIEECIFKNSTRTDMPGAIDFEPELSTSIIKDVFIKNCIFDNIGGSVGCICFVVSVSNNVDNLNINNCYFKNSRRGFAIYGYSSSNWNDFKNIYPCRIYVENNTFNQLTGYDFMIGGIEYVYIKNNQFIGNKETVKESSLIGFDINGRYYLCKNVYISNNNFKDLFNNILYGAPLYLRGTNDFYFENNIIDNCGYNKDNQGFCIFRTDDVYIKNTFIYRNIFINREKIVSYPVFLRNNTKMSYPSDIKIFENKYINIDENKISDGYGISIYDVADVKENFIRVGYEKYSNSNSYDESIGPNDMPIGISLGIASDGNNLLTCKNYTDKVDFLNSYQLKFDRINRDIFYIRNGYENNTWTEWKKYKGTNSEYLASGTWDEKPNIVNNTNVGLSYYCTDKKSSESIENGLMIFHRGYGKWTDALGREIQ